MEPGTAGKAKTSGRRLPRSRPRQFGVSAGGGGGRAAGRRQTPKWPLPRIECKVKKTKRRLGTRGMRQSRLFRVRRAFVEKVAFLSFFFFHCLSVSLITSSLFLIF